MKKKKQQNKKSTTMNIPQLYTKQTVHHNNCIEPNSDLKKKASKKIDIVKYTFDKQSEGTDEIFKKMRDAISTTDKEKK